MQDAEQAESREQEAVSSSLALAGLGHPLTEHGV